MVSYSFSSVYKCYFLSTAWYFHADIDDDLLKSDQETTSRRAYGGCLLETSYIVHVCTVNPLTCRTGTRKKKTSTKETKGKAVTTERTAGKKGKSGKLQF